MTKPAGRTSARQGEQRHGWHLIDGATLGTASNTLTVNFAQLLLGPDWRDLNFKFRGMLPLTTFAGISTPQVLEARFSTNGATANVATSFIFNVQAYYSTGGAAVAGSFGATDLLKFFGSATVSIGGATQPGNPGINLDFLLPNFQDGTEYKTFAWELDAMGTASHLVMTEGRGRWLQSSPIMGIQFLGPGGSAFADGRWELWGLKGFSPFV